MAACLADPAQGYYRAGVPVGAAGDFTTAPEINQVFGELLGAWAAATWQAIGSPAPVRLVRMLTNFLAPPHAGDWIEGEAVAVPDTSGSGVIAVHVRVRVGARTMFTADAVYATA